ncbi:MAG TPA: OmpH family outer membrane protein [bacterium (Candidatus Stahlbacteria)]|nr:OmpH family outer membrane protein [Candidatus Stahlbacteria bacterium]
MSGSLIVLIILAAVKIGIIDSDRIVTEYLGAREVKSQIEEEISKFKSKVIELQQEIERAKRDYESQKLMLSETAKAAKLKEISDIEGELNRYLNEVYGANGLAQKKYQELMGPIVDKINKAIKMVAEENDLTIVFDIAGNDVAYVKEGMDLTDLVIEELNREYEPSLPAIETRKNLCVFPFYEGNREAQEEDLGKFCQRMVNDIIRRRFSRFRFQEHFTVSRAMSKRGITRNIEDRDAFEIGRGLAAEYIILGTITKKIDRYEFEMRLGEVKVERIIATKTGTSTRKEDLQEYLAALLSEVLKSIPEE